MPWDCHCDPIDGHSYSCGYNSRFNMKEEEKMREEGPQSNIVDWQGKTSNPSVSKSSVTEENFQSLTANIDEIVNCIDRLEGRIGPILEDNIPSEKEDARGYSGPTGVSDRLANLCRNTDAIIRRLNNLVARVDL